MKRREGAMVIGLIVAGVFAAAAEVYFVSAAARGSVTDGLMFILGLWGAWSVTELWHRYGRYERILIERGLVDLLK